MKVLDYSTGVAKPRSNWRRLPTAAIIGAVAGIGASYLLYDPVLRLLSRGVQLYVADLGEPFELWNRFAAVCALGGLIVCGSAAVFGGSLRRVLAWVIGFATLFVIGAAVGLLYARNQWNPTGLRHVALASAPMLLVPVSGSVTALIAALAVAARRLAVGS